MTRRAIALQLLQDAGGAGVTTGDLMRAGVGSRYGARLKELRDEGYEIHSERLRGGSWRYILTSEPGSVQTTPLACTADPGSGVKPSGPQGPPSGGTEPPGERRDAAESGALFDLPTAAPMNAATHDWEDAA